MYSFLQLCDHTDILTTKVSKLQKVGNNFFLFFGGINKKGGKTKFQEGEQKSRGPRFFKKIGGGKLPKRTMCMEYSDKEITFLDTN